MLHKNQRIYVAGPMTGLPDFNFPAFHAASSRLREAGYDVVNPAETMDGDTTLPRSFYMRQDILALLAVDAVAALPGWENSKGASLEVQIARELELPVLNADTLEEIK